MGKKMAKPEKFGPDATPLENRFRFAIEIGKRLTQLRMRAKVSYAELGETLGYRDETSVYHIESGRSCLPSWTIGPVCEKLGCTPEELLGLAVAPSATASKERGAVAP